jgi:hypothetical protein
VEAREDKERAVKEKRRRLRYAWYHIKAVEGVLREEGELEEDSERTGRK